MGRNRWISFLLLVWWLGLVFFFLLAGPYSWMLPQYLKTDEVMHTVEDKMK